MKARISRVHFPVTNLGHGRRVGIWVQGCSIGCRGCVAVDTWNPDPAYDTTVEEVMARILAVDPAEIDGVTISGGEPFDQPRMLLELVTRLDGWRAGLDHEVDLLSYSGHAEERLRRDHADVLAHLDVLIPEPFVQGRMATVAMRGSDNQRIVPLTDLGLRRYTGDDRLRSLLRQREEMQVLADDRGVLMVGIPREQDIAALKARLRERGIELWKSDRTPR